MINILNYPEAVADAIINIMEIKSQDIKNIFLKYFIPLFQLKVNVKLFGGFRDASLEELIDGFTLTCPQAMKKKVFHHAD